MKTCSGAPSAQSPLATLSSAPACTWQGRGSAKWARKRSNEQKKTPKHTSRHSKHALPLSCFQTWHEQQQQEELEQPANIVICLEVQRFPCWRLQNKRRLPLGHTGDLEVAVGCKAKPISQRQHNQANQEKPNTATGTLLAPPFPHRHKANNAPKSTMPSERAVCASVRKYASERP